MGSIVLLVWTGLALAASRPQGNLTSFASVGALDPETVQPIAAQLGPATAYCVGIHAGAVTSPIHYGLVIRNGRVRSVENVRVGDLKGPDELEACLVRKISAWPFPGARGRTELALDFQIETATPGPDPVLGSRPVAAVAQDLVLQGRLYQPDAYVSAALVGSDPCAGAVNEFAEQRCADTRDSMLAAARKQLDDGFVLAAIQAEMGAFDFATSSFPIRVEPVLVPGGIGTPGAPSLTQGQLFPKYAASHSSDFELVGGAPLDFHTLAFDPDAAEALLAKTDRALHGVALVRVLDAYDRDLRTGAWEARARSPELWAQKRARGEVRDEDTTITWHAIDVQVVALELYDPETGKAIAGWVANGYGVEQVEGRMQLLEPPEG